MTWASTDIVPSSINLTSQYSAQVGGAADTVTFTVTAKNSAGTAFNFAAATTASLVYQGPANLPAQAQTGGAVAPTIVSATSTALTLELTTANQNSILAGLGATNSPITLLVTDGTTDLLVSTGRLAFSVNP